MRGMSKLKRRPAWAQTNRSPRCFRNGHSLEISLRLFASNAEVFTDCSFSWRNDGNPDNDLTCNSDVHRLVELRECISEMLYLGSRLTDSGHEEPLIPLPQTQVPTGKSSATPDEISSLRHNEQRTGGTANRRKTRYSPPIIVTLPHVAYPSYDCHVETYC